jgi:Tfp pilus assembly protein, ATPase PilU
LLIDLSLNLAGVVSQRLIPGLHEKLVPAVEVMLNSPYIADLIAKGEFGHQGDHGAQHRNRHVHL